MKKEAEELFWPGDGDPEEYVEETRRIVNGYRNTEQPVSNHKVNQQLKRLRNALDALTPDVVGVLEQRELSAHLWTTDEEYQFSRYRIDNDQSAVKLLRAIADANMNKARLPDSWDHHDARLRKFLIQRAAFNFEKHGGKLEARLNSGFVEYLGRLGEDAGLPETFDAFKAARDYLDPNKVMKKLLGNRYRAKDHSGKAFFSR